MTDDEDLSPVLLRLEIRMRKGKDELYYLGETSEDTKDAEEYRQWIATNDDLFRLFWAGLKTLTEKMGKALLIMKEEEEIPPARKGIS